MIKNLEKISSNKIEQIINAVNYIKESNNEINKMIIFGSVARNEANENSDVDICLVTNMDRSTKESVLFFRKSC